MNKLSLLITWRYLMGARSEKNISIMVIICFLGIFIGSFALALIASVMNGFEKATHEKLRGVNAQIIMRSFGNELDAAKISQILRDEFPEIQAFSPSTYKQVMIQKPGAQEITNAVLLKAIEPETEAKTSIMEEKIIQALNPTKKLVDLVHDNQVVIGKKLAENLKIIPGDTVELLYIPEQEQKSRKVGLGKKDAVISGIFSTGIDEFDSNLMLASFSFVDELFNHTGVSQINIQLNPIADEAGVIAKLKKRFNLDIFSWKDLYPALVAALKLEKFAMFFILALITLVASMNIISLIFMQIIQKRPDIAIYQSMGMANRQIVQLFMLMGVGIAVIATIVGLIGAYIAGILLEKYPFITLPDTYYVTHLPVAMEWYIFALVFVLVVGMSIVATWIPTRNIRAIHAAKVLRFEG